MSQTLRRTISPNTVLLFELGWDILLYESLKMICFSGNHWFLLLFFENSRKSGLPVWILIFSRFFAIFLDAQPGKSGQRPQSAASGAVSFTEIVQMIAILTGIAIFRLKKLALELAFIMEIPIKLSWHFWKKSWHQSWHYNGNPYKIELAFTFFYKKKIFILFFSYKKT